MGFSAAIVNPKDHSCGAKIITPSPVQMFAYQNIKYAMETGESFFVCAFNYFSLANMKFYVGFVGIGVLEIIISNRSIPIDLMDESCSSDKRATENLLKAVPFGIGCVDDIFQKFSHKLEQSAFEQLSAESHLAIYEARKAFKAHIARKFLI